VISEELETLDIRDSAITDEGLPYITMLTRLKQLDVNGSKTSFGGRERLENSLPKLRVIFDPFD
jgi:hypothetical protein